jgi:hypothetical protein
MPKAFQAWTVLPHQPVEKLSENLWSVSGSMPDPKIQRRMVVARLANGALVIHNAVALDDASMKELESFGDPAYLLVPNGFHRQDAFIYKQRYPKIRVLCPKSATAKVKQVVEPDGSYDDVPADPKVHVFHLRGLKHREGGLLVESAESSSAVFCDAVMNVDARGGPMGFLLAPTGRPGIPRIMRWIMISDRAEFRAHLDELASARDLARVLVGHGRTVTDDPAGTLRSLASGLS